MIQTEKVSKYCLTTKLFIDIWKFTPEKIDIEKTKAGRR